MFNTEEEARTKLCHVALASNGVASTLCAASGCMAWRFGIQGRIVERKSFATVPEADTFLTATTDARWEPHHRIDTKVVRRVPVGYCGRITTP